MGDSGLKADGDGEWQGLLFDNPVVGLAPALTWTLRIPFAPVDGAVPLLELDWLPLTTGGWRAMTGGVVDCAAFADPAEASVRHRGHHRYERVHARIAEQDGPRVRVEFRVAGDLDGYGPDEIAGDAWLAFAGVSVQLTGVDSAGDALKRLAELTDVDGLTEAPDPRGISFRFTAAG